MTFSGLQLAEEHTPRWFCLRTQTKRERVAAANLRQVEGVEAFAPQLRFRKATRRGPVWFVEALFPGYVFARFIFAQQHRQIRALPGVSTVVHFGDRFAVLPDDTIQQLTEAAGEDQAIVFDPELRIGDEVKIAAGSFSGLAATITQLLPARQRVKLLLDFLGRQIEVEVPRSDLLSTALPRIG